MAERNVRAILSAAIKASGKKRDAIAAEMSEGLGRDVTGSMIRDFTRGASKNRNVRFPAAWVPAFCNATGSDALLRFLLSPEMTAALELGEWDMKYLKRRGNPLVDGKRGASKRGAKPRRRTQKDRGLAEGTANRP